jgi:hypothetical protein
MDGGGRWFWLAGLELNCSKVVDFECVGGGWLCHHNPLSLSLKNPLSTPTIEPTFEPSWLLNINNVSDD